MWSVISSAFGSSDLGALRRYKSLMWRGHTARFAPSIASQLRRPNVELITDHILTVKWLKFDDDQRQVITAALGPASGFLDQKFSGFAR